MHIPTSEQEPLGALEAALSATIQAEAVEAKIRAAQRSGKLTDTATDGLLVAALSAGIISTEECAVVERANSLRAEVVRVDHFAPDLGASEAMPPAVPQRAAA